MTGDPALRERLGALGLVHGSCVLSRGSAAAGERGWRPMGQLDGAPLIVRIVRARAVTGEAMRGLRAMGNAALVSVVEARRFARAGRP